MNPRTCALILLSAALFLPGEAAARRYNGFDIKDPLIPKGKIMRGGPPADGIPALTDPKFLPAEKSWLRPDDRVIGVSWGGTAKAYPIRILNWHEIVNDELGGRRIAVTYCPLCGTGMVFSARAGGMDRRFGVSGLLYNSDVLLYDKETRSLWSQIMRKAVAGHSKGVGLEQLPAQNTTWKAWIKAHPKTLVQSKKTGYYRDYDSDPYGGYALSSRTMFPVSPMDDRLHSKRWVLGVIVSGKAKAYPVDRCPSKEFGDRIGGEQVTVLCDKEARTARVLDAEGEEIPGTMAYWFAWAAFHPRSAVYSAPKKAAD